jgi:uncharacterized protein YkwD
MTSMSSNKTTRGLTVAIALSCLVANVSSAQESNPAQHADLAAALSIAGNGEAVLAEMQRILPFDESSVSREYREERFEALLNLVRAEGAVCNDDGGTHAPNPAPVRSNPLLNDAAYLHANYLAEERKNIKAAGSPSSHSQTLTESPHFTGEKMGDRGKLAGYAGFVSGESVVGGNGNDAAGQSIMIWFNSSAGHCSGLFKTTYKEFGFGAVNYINDELHNNNEFKGVFMVGSE